VQGAVLAKYGEKKLLLKLFVVEKNIFCPKEVMPYMKQGHPTVQKKPLQLSYCCTDETKGIMVFSTAI
jgi:hypothetical protein